MNDKTTEMIKIEDCFFSPETWAEESKKAYREWLLRMPNSHPSKKYPEPWLTSPPAPGRE